MTKKNFPQNITCSRVDDIIKYEVDLALMEKQTVEDALKKAEDRINEVTGGE